eukprot:TRINITY_DN2084_c0_g1_i2.p1 TRINITY_DN2084_c0_g1~~TRINITY_DN2084_c0_g1_i2.p1  ORF type:complete len:126 (+),score=24.88 TRINITY_DN2084_c0_g1_i2:45-422(+)
MDPELEEIRQKRLAQLRAQQQANIKDGHGEKDREESKRAAEAERRSSILSQILMPEAKERLDRIALVRPDKSKSVEDMLISAVQSGRIRDRVDEKTLITLLEQLTQQTKTTTIKFQRRDLDDDDF